MWPSMRIPGLCMYTKYTITLYMYISPLLFRNVIVYELHEILYEMLHKSCKLYYYNIYVCTYVRTYVSLNFSWRGYMYSKHLIIITEIWISQISNFRSLVLKYLIKQTERQIWPIALPLVHVSEVIITTLYQVE